jgi:hypothetical protein
LVPVSLILALLVGRGVTAQAPSSNRNTNKQQHKQQNKIQEFKAKRNLPLSTLNNKEEFF